MGLLATVGFLARVNRFSRLSRAKPVTVAALLERRLRRLLARAVERSPLYCRRFGRLDVTRRGLADLPPLTKAEAMAGFDDRVTDPAVRRADVEAFIADHRNPGRRFRGRYVARHTSGSQGQAAVLLQERHDFATLSQLFTSRGNVAGQSGIGEMVRRLRAPTRLAVVTLKQGFYPTGTTFDFPPPQLGRW
jgi:phenylacetate-coenzyme A ligase PaaK-like adenylate-forming protein